MRRKVDVLLIIGLIVLGASYYFLASKKKNSIATSIPLAEEGFFENLTRIEIKGNFKNQLSLEKVDAFWYWNDEEGKRHHAVVDDAISMFKDIELKKRLEASKIPSSYFEGAESYVFYTSDKKFTKIFVSNKKAITGDIYLKRQSGNKLDYYLVSESFEKKLRPKIVDWIGDSLFQSRLAGLVKIEYKDENANTYASWKKQGEEFVFYKENKELLRIAYGSFVSYLESLKMFEAYPLDNFPIEDLLHYGFSSKNKQNKSLQFVFSNSKVLKLYQSRDNTKSNFFLFPERSLLFTGLNNDMRLFRANVVSFVDLSTYHKIELKEVSKISCIFSSGESFSHTYKDELFHLGKKSSKLKSWAQNLYSMAPEKVYFDDWNQSSDFQLHWNFKNIPKLKFIFSYQGDSLYFSRSDKNYYFKLSDMSKLYVKKLVSLCKGDADG